MMAIFDSKKYNLVHLYDGKFYATVMEILLTCERHHGVTIELWLAPKGVKAARLNKRLAHSHYTHVTYDCKHHSTEQYGTCGNTTSSRVLHEIPPDFPKSLWEYWDNAPFPKRLYTDFHYFAMNDVPLEVAIKPMEGHVTVYA